MALGFTNGASVSRIYSDDKPEIIAEFQYDADAINFAKARSAEDSGTQISCWYVVSNHYSGQITIIRQKAAP